MGKVGRTCYELDGVDEQGRKERMKENSEGFSFLFFFFFFELQIEYLSCLPGSHPEVRENKHIYCAHYDVL